MAKYFLWKAGLVGASTLALPALSALMVLSGGEEQPQISTANESRLTQDAEDVPQPVRVILVPVPAEEPR